MEDTKAINFSRYGFTADVVSITIEFSDGFRVVLTKEEFLQSLLEHCEHSLRDHWITKLLLKGFHPELGK